MIYADFESFIEKIDGCEKDTSRSSTTAYQHHTPSGFCFHLKCFDDSIHWESPKIYTKTKPEENLGEIFTIEIEKTVKEIYEKFKKAKPMIYGIHGKKIYEESEVCWLCEGKFEKPKYFKVRDHCHLTGKFRGAAHNSCNLKYRLPKCIPVHFHNLSGYDAHLFVKSLGITEGTISCIPNNEEKYISFSKSIVVDHYTNKKGEENEIFREIIFIDSFKFMASSLDKLVSNLDKDKLVSTKKVFDNFELVSKKGVYPYEWIV